MQTTNSEHADPVDDDCSPHRSPISWQLLERQPQPSVIRHRTDRRVSMGFSANSSEPVVVRCVAARTHVPCLITPRSEVQILPAPLRKSQVRADPRGSALSAARETCPDTSHHRRSSERHFAVRGVAVGSSTLTQIRLRWVPRLERFRTPRSGRLAGPHRVPCHGSPSPRRGGPVGDSAKGEEGWRMRTSR